MEDPEPGGRDLTGLDFGVSGLGMRAGWPDPRGAWRLVDQLRQWRPAIVHSHMVHANLLARVSRPFTSLPVLVTTGHNFDEGAAWRYWAYRLTDRFADLTTNVSRASVAEAVRRGAVPAHRVLYVPNGIDTSLFDRSAELGRLTRRDLGLEEAFVFLAAGRLVCPAKGFDVLLRAAEDVVRVNPGVRVVIAGDGPLRAELESDAKRLGLSQHVRLLGARDDMPALMSAADAFVMPSRWEGLPLVLLEAAATRLPCLATDVGGNREVVADGRSGYLIPEVDATSLAGAMVRLAGLDRQSLLRMGAAGRADVERAYSLDTIVLQWQEIYRSLLHEKGLTPVDS